MSKYNLLNTNNFLQLVVKLIIIYYVYNAMLSHTHTCCVHVHAFINELLFVHNSANVVSNTPEHGSANQSYEGCMINSWTFVAILLFAYGSSWTLQKYIINTSGSRAQPASPMAVDLWLCHAPNALFSQFVFRSRRSRHNFNRMLIEFAQHMLTKSTPPPVRSNPGSATD